MRPERDATAERSSPDLAPLDVLLIDSDADNAVRITALLAAEGTDTHWARTLREGRQHLLGHDSQVIVLDLSPPDAPGLVGVSVMAVAAPGIPVVVLTSRHGDALALAALAEGAEDFVGRDEIDDVLVPTVMRAHRRAEARDRLGEGARLAAETLDGIEAPTVAVDGRGYILTANKSWLRVAAESGSTPDQVGVGTSYLDVCDRAVGPFSDGADEAAQGLRDVLCGDVPQFAIDYPCPNRQRDRWLTMRATPLGGAGGGAVVTHLDITAVKRAEFKLRSNERRSQTSIDETAEIFAVLDEDGQILELSPRTAELLGIESGRAVGTPALDWVHELERDAAQRTFQGLLAIPGSRAELDLRVLDSGLRWRNLRVAAANHLLHPGVRGVVISGTDVTARRRAQIAHHLQPRLLELLPAGVAVTDSAGVIAYWNAHAEVLYGYTSDEVVGSEIERLAIGPNDPAIVYSIFERISQGQPWDGDYDSKRKDGRPISVYVTMQPIEDDETGFEGIVAAFVDISDRRQLEQDLAFRALHDPLTGLPNRTLFADRVRHALDLAARNGTTVGVLFLDLDDFKSVNDYHGQAAGDAILLEVAARISGAIRAEDTLARTAGDEFAICCEDVGGVEEARTIADRIFEVLGQPFHSANRSLLASASVGIALAREPDHAGTLLRKASTAMNRAKELGKGQCELFDQDLDRQLQQRRVLQDEFRRALTDHELVVWYQPEVELASGRVIGAEALVRWEHPIRGLLPPSDFLPMAEQTGLICDLDRWVLDDVLQQMAAWADTAVGCPETISVNVSARELNETAFVERLTKGLTQWGVEPSALCIEVTEGLLVEDTVLCAALLTAVRDLGVKVAIDDFGTGYSSLRYLKSFPLDRLKVDRSFVRNLGSDPQDTAIVSAIVVMAHALGLQVVVEGVETPMQLQQAQALGCRRGQGYFWSRPVTAADFTNLIGRRLPAGAEQRAI